MGQWLQVVEKPDCPRGSKRPAWCSDPSVQWLVANGSGPLAALAGAEGEESADD